MTNAADIAAGQTALDGYVSGVEGWFKTSIIRAKAPHAFRDGASDVVRVMDAAKAMPSATPASIQAAAQAALRKAINATGYGDQVTDQQIHDGTAVVIAAVNKSRAHQA